MLTAMRRNVSNCSTKPYSPPSWPLLARVPVCAQSVDDIGLSATLVGTDLIDPDPVTGFGPNKTIRVWAELPSGWRLDAVAGNASNPMSIEVVGGSFYQDAFGGPTSRDMNPLLFSLAPSLEWDTFLTIGALTSVDNELQQIGMVWTDFEAGNSLAINNGSVFVVPTEPQGELQTFTGSCGQARSGVLIGQFTLLGEGASLICSVLLQGKDESDVVWQQPMVIDASTDCNGDILTMTVKLMPAQIAIDDGVLDDCQIEASTDCNDDGVLDECQIDASPDCNGDGVLDDCQIDASTDCNDDGVLDECQIEVSSDCNDDGVLDECQIDASTDCNDDGVLDDCQIEGQQQRLQCQIDAQIAMTMVCSMSAKLRPAQTAMAMVYSMSAKLMPAQMAMLDGDAQIAMAMVYLMSANAQRILIRVA